MRMSSLHGQIAAQEGRTPYKPLGQNGHSGLIQPRGRAQSPVTQGLRGRGLKPHTIREDGGGDRLIRRAAGKERAASGIWLAGALSGLGRSRLFL